MIFIPIKNVEKTTLENNEDFLIWNYDDNTIITFVWKLSPKYDKEKEFTFYKKDNDPFYLELNTLNGTNIFECSLDACKAKPQLRYNKIIDKWYCNCPSSAICTDNNDEDELKEMLKFYEGQFDEEHGFCKNPIEAIIRWNISSLKNELEKNYSMLEEIKKGV